MDYIAKLLLAIDRVRPWNSCTVLHAESPLDQGGWSITSTPMFYVTHYRPDLTAHTESRRARR